MKEKVILAMFSILAVMLIQKACTDSATAMTKCQVKHSYATCFNALK